MRILVTGGAGFIGSHLVRLLVRRGHEVLNIDKLTYAGNLASLRDVSDSPNYRFLQADIADAPAMRAAFADFRPDAVAHLAAESHVDRSIDAPGDFIRTNIHGTHTLLEAARHHWASSLQHFSISESQHFNIPKFPPRFLHVSTDEVYGSLGTDEPPFTESSPYRPHSPYSASKAASDHLARAWHDTFGLPVIVTNCPNNYGPFQFPEKLVPLVILKALRGEPIPVYGTGENIRDWIHVEDHADALLAVLEHGVPGETYHVGAHDERRNLDLVRFLCLLVDELREPSASHRPPPSETLITFVLDRPGHDLRYAMNAEKIRKELGWTPQHSPESGLRETVRWYLENEDWWQPLLDHTYRLERLGSPS